REELVDVLGREVRKLEEEGRELDVSLAVVARVEEEVFAAEHGADLVELRLSDVVDALPDDRVRELARAHPLFEVVVNVAMERPPPYGVDVVAVRTRDE